MTKMSISRMVGSLTHGIEGGLFAPVPEYGSRVRIEFVRLLLAQ
jgi:hypothetical protein